MTETFSANQTTTITSTTNVIETIEKLGKDASPIISGGYGDLTHPTQGLLDMYTAYRALGGDFKKMTVMIATPDLSRARSGQSFGLGLARMGTKLIYSGTTGLEIPLVIREKLKKTHETWEPKLPQNPLKMDPWVPLGRLFDPLG